MCIVSNGFPSRSFNACNIKNIAAVVVKKQFYCTVP